ncbi:MAG: BrnA antitoxin family protein [Alphaproteobacteria bacterium]
MARKRNIVRYTAAELAELPSKSDFARVDRMSEADLEAAIAADPDWRSLPEDWYSHASPAFPAERLERVEVELDPDVIAWFRRRGRDSSKQINAALRAFMIARENAEK